MFERFTGEAREAVGRAERAARERGTRRIGAEHLLLAAGPRAGLDAEAFAAALDEERRASLVAVGVEIEPPVPRPARGGRTRFDASARLALSRSVAIATARRERRIGPGHVVLGALEAEVGTVPRALALAGIDREELRARASAG